MITFALAYLRTAFNALHLDERGQDAFEYLLVIGGVSVAVIIAIVTPVGGTVIDALIDGVCGAINGIPGVDGGDGPFSLDCSGDSE